MYFPLSHYVIHMSEVRVEIKWCPVCLRGLGCHICSAVCLSAPEVLLKLHLHHSPFNISADLSTHPHTHPGYWQWQPRCVWWPHQNCWHWCSTVLQSHVTAVSGGVTHMHANACTEECKKPQVHTYCRVTVGFHKQSHVLKHKQQNTRQSRPSRGIPPLPSLACTSVTHMYSKNTHTLQGCVIMPQQTRQYPILTETQADCSNFTPTMLLHKLTINWISLWIHVKLHGLNSRSVALEKNAYRLKQLSMQTNPDKLHERDIFVW